MPDQPTLDLAYADRHAGQEANLAAGSAGHRDHRDIVELAVALLAKNRARSFTADDVHKLVAHTLADGYDRNLVSSVMGRWAADGRITRDTTAGLVPSCNRSRKGSRNSWWRGGTRTAPFPQH
ncbi:hypothetical protein [Saccharothrix stipae]